MRLTARCLCEFRARQFAADAARVRRPRGSAVSSDPTGTMRLQRRWSRDLDQRWSTIKRMLPQAIASYSNPISMISHSVLTGAHDPVQHFQSWLDESMRQIIVGINGSWLLPYVREASDAGSLHARQTTKSDSSSSVAVQDRTHLLQSLAITELQGICEAVSQQLVRAYTNSLLTKQTPSAVAGAMRAVIDDVGVRRGYLLISFMCVRSFNAAALDGFRASGVTHVGTVAERTGQVPPGLVRDAKASKTKSKSKSKSKSKKSGGGSVFPSLKVIRAENKLQRKFGGGGVDVRTAGDDDVCFVCQDISDNGPYTLDEAESLIPAHPRCRCAFVPANKEDFVGGDPEDDEGNLLWSGDSITHIAAGVIITADNTGRTLFLRRAGKGYETGTWAFPGGAVEPGETVEQAAARETREEIGYEPSASEMDQVHRAVTNGVDFTTYMHNTEREFRPHLNGEHDAHKWALIENAPEPLHPGVERTLSELDEALRMRDEGAWNEEDHPRDKSGKFTFKGGEGAGAELGKKFSGYKDFKYQGAGKSHGYTVPEAHVEEFKQAASLNNVKLEGNAVEGGYHYFYANTPDVPALAGKTSSAPDPENEPPSKEAPTPPTPIVHAAPPPAHPSQQYLASVKGNSPERVALRTQLKSAKSASERDELQAKIVASFWKQHDNLTKSGKLEQAAEIKGKLQKYAKSYKLDDPLAAPKAVALAASVAPATNPKPVAKTFGKAVHTPKDDPLDFKSLTKVEEQKGSNPGGVYADASGNRYYIKTMDEAHAKNELLAAKLYALAGSKTLDYVPVKPDGAVHYVATRYESLDKNNVSQLSTSELKQARDDFATHAWLANWDAAGTGGDNQGVKNGVVKTLDVGGSLEYRAKGTPKGDAFGNSATEFDTLRDPNKNHDAAMLFKPMTDEQIKSSVLKIDPVYFDKGDIAKTVQSVYGDTPKAKELTDKLAARQADLVKRAANLGKAAAAPDLSHMSEEDQRMHWLEKTIGPADKPYLKYHLGTNGDLSETTLKKLAEMGLSPAEVGFIRAFTGPVSHVNKQMRDGVMDDHVFAYKHIMNEALDKFPVYEGDKLWRKIHLNEKQVALYEPGKIVHWQAFSSTSKNSGTWDGNTHFTIHNPKSGRDVQFISENPKEAEVIMPADTYYRVLSKKQSGINTYIELEEVLPFGKVKKQKKAA